MEPAETSPTRTILDSGKPTTPEPSSPVPQSIGPYQVIRPLGAGGMGDVYYGIQKEEGLERPVAIKFIRHSESTGAAAKRFEFEKKILGSLNHPNIARILSAGVLNDGRAYFVMEYIEGQSIDAYCDERELDIEDRIRLFLKVCGAVYDAHQNLVIHRDIKPANILVGATGEPKLVDFGIARLLHAEQDASAAAMDIDATPMTPRYASPEQVRGGLLTTSTDLYSLGVLLYELLTGHSPHAVATLEVGDLIRAICEGEPEAPSTIVKRDVTIHLPDGETRIEKAEIIARLRDRPISGLSRRMSGDLDAIVLKALQKTPKRRYESVKQFAEDLQRYLDGLPVEAVPNALPYRVRKFIGRNKVGVGFSVVAGLALAVAGFGIVWQSQVASTQRDMAEERFDAVRELARFLVFDVEEQLRQQEGSTELRNAILDKGLAYHDRIAGQASGNPDLQRELAAGYLRLGQSLEGSRAGSLGRRDEALAALNKGRSILEPMLEATPNDGVLLRDHALALIQTADIEVVAGRLTVAMAALDQAIEELDLAAKGGEDVKLQLAAALLSRADVGRALGKGPSVEADTDRSLALRRELVAEDPGNLNLRRSLGIAYGRRGKALDSQGREQAALDAYALSLEQREAIFASDPESPRSRRDVAVEQERIGMLLLKQLRIPEAAASLESSHAHLSYLREADEGDVRALVDLLRSHVEIGDLRVQQRQFDDASVHFSAAIDLGKVAAALRVKDPQREYRVAMAQRGLADLAARTGEDEEALKLYESVRRSLRGLMELYPQTRGFQLDAAVTAHRAALSLERLNRIGEAVFRYGEAHDLYVEARVDEMALAEAEAAIQAAENTTTLTAEQQRIIERLRRASARGPF